MNLRKVLLIIAVVLIWTATVAAGTKSSSEPNTAAQAFDRLKSLVGTWEAETEMGKAQAVYELVSGGSVLLERTAVGSEPAMVTAYHLDGSKLQLTHYCLLGNQPRMVAKGIDPQTGEIAFEFAGATNLAGPNAQHMHTARLRLVDNDHFTSEWTLFENAKPKHTHTARYSRVK